MTPEPILDRSARHPRRAVPGLCPAGNAATPRRRRARDIICSGLRETRGVPAGPERARLCGRTERLD
jgi:hypothetical protein